MALGAFGGATEQKTAEAVATTKTVIRAGIGVVYNSTSNQIGTPSNSGASGTPAFGQIVGLRQNGLTGAGVSAVWPTFNAAAGQAPGAVVAPPTLLDPNAGTFAPIFPF